MIPHNKLFQKVLVPCSRTRRTGDSCNQFDAKLRAEREQVCALKHRTNKKGQMEILGLAMVFTLILVGFLVFLRFLEPPSSPTADFYLEQLPTQTLQAIAHTTTPCKQQTVKTLITDIVEQGICQPDGTYQYDPSNEIQCDGETSNSTLFDETGGVVPELLDAALTDDGFDYEFAININNCNLYEKKNNFQDNLEGCERSRRIDAQALTYQTKKGEVIMSLKIC